MMMITKYNVGTSLPNTSSFFGQIQCFYNHAYVFNKIDLASTHVSYLVRQKGLVHRKKQKRIQNFLTALRMYVLIKFFDFSCGICTYMLQ